MSFNTEGLARKAGSAILDLMPNGWKLRVWNNLGWHYSLEKGPICVHPSFDGNTYWAMIATDAGECGHGGPWTSKGGNYVHPMDAVIAAIDDFKNWFAGWQGIQDAVSTFEKECKYDLCGT